MNEQPALDFDVPEPVSGDERIAREEIERFYAERVSARQAAFDKAAAELAAAQRLMATWHNTGKIAPMWPESNRHREELTALAIADEAVNRHTSAMQDAIRPILHAPTCSEAMAEARRISTSPDAADLLKTAEDLGGRAEALCRWLTAQGYDLGLWSAPGPGIKAGSKPRKRR
jgi:hypothetical protein